MKYKYDIVVAGWTGLKESINRLTDTEYKKKLEVRYPKHFIEKVKNRQDELISTDIIRNQLSYFKPSYLSENGQVSSEELLEAHTIIYIIGEGGLYRALWDISVAINKGFEIDRYSIPVLQETVEVCDFFNENLYEVDGNGSFLIYTDDATSVMKMLADADISSKLIGFATKELAKQIIRDDDIQCLDKPRKSLMGK